MLVYDPEERITPKDALEHPYFDPVRAKEQIVEENEDQENEERNEHEEL